MSTYQHFHLYYDTDLLIKSIPGSTTMKTALNWKQKDQRDFYIGRFHSGDNPL